MEGPEWDTQVHGTVHPGRGAEETAIISGGGEGGQKTSIKYLGQVNLCDG